MAENKQENSDVPQVYAKNGSTSVGSINVGGNVGGDIHIGNTTNNYYTSDGEEREIRTGWFYGHRYGDLENFTGRAVEMQMLDEWLGNDKDNLLVLTAFGGFGKSALTWQWFNNRVDKAKWQTAVWWSFYEKESGFESFLADTLKHLDVEVKASARMQLNDLLEAMRGTEILIVLDGFERLLRQYGRMDAALQSDDEDAEIDPSQRDCSSPLTETFLRGLSGAGMKSKVLMTTRLCPRVLESADGKLLKGCREAPLAAFAPEDAVTYFHNEGVKATRAETSALCYAYGYHPLSLSLLVGLINADHEKRGDIKAVKNLEIFADVKARRHHVLERAYGSLAPERRDLLSKMSCFRGSMEYAVLKKVFPSPDLDKSLLDLRKRGLLQYAGETQRYDMHPIVRHYAYERMTDADRSGTHEQLAHYFEAVPKPEKVDKPEDLVPVIELYYHIAKAGRFDDAASIYNEYLENPIYFQFGNYQLAINLLKILFPDGEEKPPKIDHFEIRMWALNELGRAYASFGQPYKSILLREMHIRFLSETRLSFFNTIVNNRIIFFLSTGMSNLALQELSIGRLKDAENHMLRSIRLCQGIDDPRAFLAEALRYSHLGMLLFYRGMWSESYLELNRAMEKAKICDQPQTQGINWSDISLFYLLSNRSNIKKSADNIQFAIKAAQQALVFADEDARIDAPTPRDYIRAYWLLGTAYLMNNELALAEENLSKALSLCRQINMVDHEADILLDLARLRYAQGDFKDAQEKASEALVITERSGYVLQGADVNNFLAELALVWREKGIGNREWGGKEMARKYAEEALRLATCDGPPYYYKVAYEEAEAMLEKLK